MVKIWMKKTLLIAGIYNILWGAWAVLFPNMAFELAGAELPNYPQIWQCVGMIVGVYGLGYLIAAKSPLKHWPIVMVGLLGKIFGPIGFAWSIYQGTFPIKFGWNILFNDLIWWIPFTFILKAVWDRRGHSQITKGIDESEFSHFPDRKRATFINGLSGYKSSNLIGTIDGNGHTNLSIISSLFHLGASPALVGFIIRPSSARRDTLENILETKCFTINHVNKDILEQAHQTSARYPQEVSEFDACDLTAEYLDQFKAPFVAESRIKMAVELVREEKIIENNTHFIIGRIKKVYLPEDCLDDDGHVDINRAGSLCVSGLDTYLEGELIGRLSYAKTDRKPQWI